MVSRGETPQSVFEVYSTLDGLTHNRISDIYTDSKGFVWICTWYGVSRFDGYNFKNYSARPGDFSPLTHNRFLSVSEDADGHLWFMTYNHHVYRFNRATELFEDPILLLEGVDSKHYRTSHIQHDSRGTTWVAIPGVGLIAFKGESEGEALKLQHSFRDDSMKMPISMLHVDLDGCVWFLTHDNDLYRVLESGERELIAHLDEKILDSVDRNGRVWLLTPTKIYSVADDKELEIVGRGENFTAFASDNKSGVIYAGTRGGRLYSIGGESKGLSQIAPRGDKLTRVRDLYVDSHGLVWIVTPEAGITRYDPSRRDFKHFEQAPYTVSYNIDTLPKIAEADNRVWIKLNKYGFGYYDRDKDVIEPFYNDPTRPECLMTNAVVRFDVQQDVLWLTTYYERGLRRALILKQPAEVLTVDSRLADEMSSEIRAMITDSKRQMWFGTKSGELMCYGEDGELRHRFTKGGHSLGMVYSLKEDSDGVIWVGTRGMGLYSLIPNRDGEGYTFGSHYRHDSSDIYSLSNDHIYSIEEDDYGRLWIATYGGGLNMFDKRSMRFTHSANQLAHYPYDEADRVRWLLNDGMGRMLAATVDGLLVFYPSSEPQKIEFNLAQKIPGDITSLGNNDIIHMLKDSKGRIWLATYGGGLNRIVSYDEDGMPRFKGYDLNEGLPGNICMSVVEDGFGNIWTATQNAISCLNEQSGSFSNYVLYDDHSSVSFNETGGMLAPDGRVLFVGKNKIYAFTPNAEEESVEPSQLCFTGFSIKNAPAEIGEGKPLSKSVTIADKVILPHNYSNFRIEFASLNFSLQDKINYMYKLEGYDQDWNMVGRHNSASYSNVPEGSYLFRVKGYVGSSTNTDQELTLKVVITPPVWLTWWAKLFYLILIGLVIVTAWHIINSMQRIRREASLEQEMTDMKLRFFTNISHELRTPLTLILGGIEEVGKNEGLSQRGKLSLSLAQKNARRMLAMINQLLDFRKIVKDKMELKISRVNLVQLVEDAVEDFREMASERNIELLFTVARRSILVWVDLERMESVVYNLLSNAFKFTRNGGRIEVILTVNDKEDVASMVVRDNGIGIAKDQQSAIFERFHQASRSVSGNFKGSGIGLALTKDIIALHHGEIGVESRPGEGSVFTVRLKMGNSHFEMGQINFGEVADGARAEYMVSDYVEPQSGRRVDVAPPKESQLILVVDDNRELRLFMYNNLIDNYRVVEAEDGEEALTIIKRDMPDIVITDLMMPKMDGIELINNIRKDFSISHIPVIMLTAKHSPDDRIKAMEFGADGYITKPFSIELLMASIDNLLTRRRTLFEKFSSQSARNKIVKLKPDEIVVTDKDEAFINSVMSWLGENIENSDLTIEQLANFLGLGRTTMYNKLKSLTGKSPVELIKEYRINKSKLLLQTGQFSVSEVAYKVGFSDPGYFSRCFKEQFNISPAEYLKTNNLKQNSK